jgi:MATE family multidrug resistance protein
MAVPPAVAQLVGAERRSEIGPVVRQALWIGLGLALLAMAVLRGLEPLLLFLNVEAEIVPGVMGYLRGIAWGMPALCGYHILRYLSDGLSLTRPAMYLGVAGIPLNVAGNYALMFGNWGFPQLGAAGCGYATAIVLWAQLAGMATLVALGRSYRSVRLFERWEAPDPGRIAELLWIGVPIGVAIFIEASLFASVSLLLGSLGTLTVAGHQVAINFVSLTFMIPLGLSMAITVRVGTAEGRGDRAGVRLAGWVGIALALCAQVVSATAMLVFPRWIASIYTPDPEVIAIAVKLFIVAAIFQLSDGLQVSSAGALRGLKDTRVPMVITVIAYWIIGLPLGWYLGFRAGIGAVGMWTGLIAGLTIAAVLLTARFYRLSRR